MESLKLQKRFTLLLSTILNFDKANIYEKKHKNEFQKAGDLTENHSLIKEFANFLRYNKKWWMVPIILVILLLGLLIMLGGTATAPFIYTLF